jgi:hypothetical protein
MRQILIIIFLLLFFANTKSQVSTMTYTYNNKTWTIKYNDTVTTNRLVIRGGLPIFIDGLGNQIDTTKLMSCVMTFGNYSDLLTITSTSLAKAENLFMLADKKGTRQAYFTNIKIGDIKIADFNIKIN